MIRKYEDKDLNALLDAWYSASQVAHPFLDEDFLVQGNDELREVIGLLRRGFFASGDTELFRPLLDTLVNHDPFFVLADFSSYAECQDRINEAYLDKERWTRMSILNAARSGKFSSDRTVREYASEIWRVDRVPIELLTSEDMRARILQ